MHPRQTRDTFTPLFPRLTYSIAVPSCFFSAGFR
jgi:hypothetical protein